MTRSELNNEYFEWMCSLVKRPRFSRYRKLLYFLHSVEFTYTIPMDDNRADDGMDLRYRFGYEHEYSGAMIASYLDDRPCSVLEMMVALAIRCEEHIMGDPDIGDRTSEWFWGMVRSLGLAPMRDDRFDEDRVEMVISRFLDRTYERNGEGSLFTVEGTDRDLRNIEIWYQMCCYLDSIM